MKSEPNISHPSDVLYEHMECYDLNAAQLAAALGVSPTRIQCILSRTRGITPDTALRLGKLFGTDPRFWLEEQIEYDLMQAKEAIGKKIELVQSRKVSKRLMKKYQRAYDFAAKDAPVEGEESEENVKDDDAIMRAKIDSIELKCGFEYEVYEALKEGEVHFDKLVDQTGLGALQLSASLTCLELEGIVRRSLGDYYAIARDEKSRGGEGLRNQRRRR